MDYGVNVDGYRNPLTSIIVNNKLTILIIFRFISTHYVLYVEINMICHQLVSFSL